MGQGNFGKYEYEEVMDSHDRIHKAISHLSIRQSISKRHPDRDDDADFLSSQSDVSINPGPWRDPPSQADEDRDEIRQLGWFEGASEEEIAEMLRNMSDEEVLHFMAVARGEVELPERPEMERVSTKPSTGQSEEATQRTEQDEGDLLERIRAENAKSRENLGEKHE